ncbi:hypothetical protein Tco_0568140 [Tanacetum coccineum]
MNSSTIVSRIHLTSRNGMRSQFQLQKIILTRIDNDIYSTVDACPNACEMWKAIESLKQGESINVQDLETNLYWEFGKFTSIDGETLKSYYSKFYKMMNELLSSITTRMAKNEPTELRAERLARNANPLVLVAQQQLVSILKTILLTTLKIPHQDNHKLLPETKEKQLAVNVAGAKETVGTQVVQHYGIQSYNYKEYGHVARECQKLKRPKDAAYHKEKMLLFRQKEAGFQLNVDQADWRDDTDEEAEDQELEAHDMYMAQIEEISPDGAGNFGPVFDEPLQKVQNDDDNYNVFANESEHPEQPKSINNTYMVEHDDSNVIIDSLDMCNNGGEAEQDNDDDLARECDLLASLIEKLKYEIDDRKNHNKFLESSNKTLVDKLKSEIDDFKNKNKSLESSNNHFKEANKEFSKTNQLMFKDLKKFQSELDRYHDVNYTSKVELECAKAKGELMSYKMSSEKSFNEYTRKINDLNQTISDMKKELVAHQEKLSIMSQEKEAQKKFYKTREDKEMEKVIALENKISFVKPEFLKKAQRANPRLYDIGCYNDNLTLMLAPESDDLIRLAHESRSKLSDLIKPFDYNQLNNLYDLFVPQREKSAEQRIFKSFDPFVQNTIAGNFSPQIRAILANFDKFHSCLTEEMVDDLRYFKSLKLEVDSLKSQLETQKTQFLNEIDRLSREYYYADHMNAILGVYTKLDEVTNLQCDYLDAVENCQRLEKERSKRSENVNNKAFNELSKRFSVLEQHSINLELALQQSQEQIKNDKAFKETKSIEFLKEREEYFKIQDLKAQLQDKGIAIVELKKLIEKLKGKFVETKFEKSSVIRQPNAFKSQRNSILGKPSTFSDSLAKKDFSKPVTA